MFTYGWRSRIPSRRELIYNCGHSITLDRICYGLREPRIAGTRALPALIFSAFSIRLTPAISRRLTSSIPRLSLPSNKRHEKSKDQQNPSPPEIDVNPKRTLIHVRIGREKAKEH
jgi:hypothetical protein